MEKRGRACVVVLGDIGRSPRMQYHSLSLARQVRPNIPFFFFGYLFYYLSLSLTKVLMGFLLGVFGGRHCCLWRYFYNYNCWLINIGYDFSVVAGKMLDMIVYLFAINLGAFWAGSEPHSALLEHKSIHIHIMVIGFDL